MLRAISVFFFLMLNLYSGKHSQPSGSFPAYIFLAQQLQRKKRNIPFLVIVATILELTPNGSDWPELGNMHVPESITVARRMGYFNLSKPGSCGDLSTRSGGVYHTLLTWTDLSKRWFLKRKLDAEEAKTMNVQCALIGQC